MCDPFVLPDNACEDDIAKLFNQNFAWVVNKDGKRLVLCRSCKKVVTIDDCWTYGGTSLLNEGECFDCERRRNDLTYSEVTP